MTEFDRLLRWYCADRLDERLRQACGHWILLTALGLDPTQCGLPSGVGLSTALGFGAMPAVFALPEETVVLPGHDYRGMTSSTIGEERRHNPRLAGKSREDFIALMNNLKLPPPKKLDLAVPANRACGRVVQSVLPRGNHPCPSSIKAPAPPTVSAT